MTARRQRTGRRVWSILGLLGGLLVPLAGGPAHAAERGYPAREIEFVVPFPPGGPADISARIIAPRMAALLGVPVVVTNKPGGGGAVGAAFVANARPDGYTVYASTNPPLTITTVIQKDVPYRMGDLVPVGSYAVDGNVFAVRADAPFRTLEELADYARKQPGKLSYGSAGLGTVAFFTMELFKLSAGVDIAHVPFAGGGPLKNAILGGHVQVASTGISALAAVIHSGNLQPLAITSPKRLPAFPQIPTMAEKGYPEASLTIWMGLYVPAKAPPAVVDVLGKALAQAARDPAVVGAVEKAGMQGEYRDAAATHRLLEAEHSAIRGAAQKLGMDK